MKKKILVTLILIMILVTNLVPVYAATPDSNIWERAKKWINLGKTNKGKTRSD